MPRRVPLRMEERQARRAETQLQAVVRVALGDPLSRMQRAEMVAMLKRSNRKQHREAMQRTRATLSRSR